ncbi:hypothetical protein DYB36_010883 [Aphanomyces astaci]|uniref:Uncharacterized protein n=1 Tax=Aphanomyces astaci TaxID=112090 RepID=A0A397B1K5_APHAT|nr:hypothetical protein DYB36_010883 [Aphanomyces astaci]
MGRSQLQFRSRGRGGRDGGSGQRGGRRDGRKAEAKPLESNAYRFAEDEDDEDDGYDEVGDVVGDGATTKRNLRFNPDIQHQTLGTGGAGHFQTKTMREWDDGIQKQPLAMALDLHEIGRQLQTVAPDKRFQIDSKYCIDLPYKAQPATEGQTTLSPPSSQIPPLPATNLPTKPSSLTAAATSTAPVPLVAASHQAHTSPQVPVLVVQGTTPAKAVVTQVLPPPQPETPAPACEIDDELDELLNM